VDFAETIDQIQLREAVRDVAAQYGHAYYADKVRQGEKTDELWQALADLGFLSVHLPEEFGGGGAGIAELAIVCEEVAAVGCPLLLLLVSAAICAELIARFGTEEQKLHWLPGLAGGRKMAFAITEPDAGSNSHRLSTVATRQGDS
jgi:alkylation response protein AidB-like acyl-CoA dehydrogenase